MKRALDWIPVCVGVLLLSFLISLQWPRVARGQNDFAALYAGAQLAGTADLYSRAANQEVIRQSIGITMETVVYSRPPFYAVLLKPLVALPYLWAYGLFCAACVGSVLWFVIRFRRECEALPLYASFFLPVAAFLPQGQDAPLLLTFFGWSVLLARRGRLFWSGVALSLCAIKFHLFILIPLVLLLRKRWSVLAGGCAGVLGLTVLGVIVAGPGALADYWGVLRDPWINFSADMMPNLHGMAQSLGWGSSVELALAATVVGAVAWSCTRTDQMETLLGLALVGGLLISFHSGMGDQLLMLPAFILLIRSAQGPLRLILALAMTPIPYLATGGAISLWPPVFALLILGLAAFQVTRLEADVPSPAI